jgi:hypothetical protein
MDWSELGEAIAGYAPLLGGVIGGPAGGAIGSIVASVFGVQNKPEAILEAVKADPEAAVKLRMIELDNKAELQKIAVELAKAEIIDKQNARKENKHSAVPALLSAVLSMVIVVIIYLLFYTPVPEGSKDVLFMLLGVVVKEWGNAMQYWFGTTRSSENKDLK